MRLPHFARIGETALRLWRCERGAEGLEKLLIVGAIVIPLLGVLIFFRDQITGFLTGEWDEVIEDADAYDPDDPGSGNDDF